MGDRAGEILYIHHTKRRFMTFHEGISLNAYIEEQWRRATEDRDKFVSLDEYEKSRGLK